MFTDQDRERIPVSATIMKGTPRLFLLLVLLLTKAGGDHSAANSHHPTRSRSTPEHPHTHLTTAELIQVRGYPAEIHHVTTDDGYILEIHRIPHGRNTQHTFPTVHTHPYGDSLPSAHILSHAQNLPYTNDLPNPYTLSNTSTLPYAYNFPDLNILRLTHNFLDAFQRALHKNDGGLELGEVMKNATLKAPGGRSHYRGNRGKNYRVSRSRNYKGSRSSNDRGSSESRIGKPRVVFVMHGVLFSSSGFVLNDPDQALGFILADAGYDVWLGNARGTSYGRRHVNLSPNQPEFWDFSFNEVALYDVPAMLRHVRKTTGAAQIDYVAHSLGASIFFAMVNYHPHINSWVRVVAAMAPAAHVRGRPVPLSLLSPFANVIDEQLTRLGKLELFPLTDTSMSASTALCDERTFASVLCIIFYFSMAGGVNSVYLDKEYLPVIFSHWPDSIGLHMFVQLLQIHHSGGFHAFDFGGEKNLAVYGSPFPPDFSLSAVTVPVGVFWSENDWVTDPKGVRQTVAELPRVVLDYRVPLSDFNHADFVLADNAADLVYRPILQLLDHYSDCPALGPLQ